MPREPRFYLPNVPAHIVQRGNCRQAVFFSADDYRAYLDWLKEGAIREALFPDDIRSAVQTGTPLGNDHFRDQIETALKRKVGQARRGRPSTSRKKGY